MQTFLPYENFSASAEVIDNDRLGNQCYRECTTLFRILVERRAGGWANHPACKMWKGHEKQLAEYGRALAIEMGRRKKKDGSPKWRAEVVQRWSTFWHRQAKLLNTEPPTWLGDEELHRAHRSNLLRKMPEHYRQFWPDERDDLPYIWPV
jgi:hypothetical protein